MSHWIDTLPPTLRTKVAACREGLKSLGSVLVAFSGGVDSTFLLALAVETLGRERVLAAIGVSKSYPQREHESAVELAGKLGAQAVEVHTNEMADPTFTRNPKDRCFHCKTDLFVRLRELAAARGLAAVVSGANADDTGDFRPGIAAGNKLGVVNPLMAAGMTKQDIRDASRAMGLPTWDKPSMACLASRIPYGSEITAERLARIEKAEDLLHDLGFAQCRVRDHGQVARIEVPAESLPAVLAARQQIVAPLQGLGYLYVTVDLQGFRSGSMNEALGLAARGAADKAGADKGHA